MCLFYTKTHCEKTEQTWAIIKIQQVFTTGNCIREALKMIENNLYTLYRNCSTMIIDKGIFFCKKRRLGYHTSYKTRWPFGRMAPSLSKKMRKKNIKIKPFLHFLVYFMCKIITSCTICRIVVQFSNCCTWVTNQPKNILVWKISSPEEDSETVLFLSVVLTTTRTYLVSSLIWS